MDGFEELWPGGPVFRQSEDGLKLSTDSVLLADFAAARRGARIIDLGCGAGVLGVLLGVRIPDSKIFGIEIQSSAAELCRCNMLANGLDAEGIKTGDLRLCREMFAAGSFDLVVSNPPYFSEGSGFSAPNPARAEARDERSCTLEELCSAARWLCRWGGTFSLVHRPERLAAVFSSLTANGFEPKRLRCVQHRAESAPSLVLVEGRRGGGPGLSIAPPLILTAPDGSESEESRRIYRR